MTLQLESPFSIIVSGPSGCGKSSWTCHLLNNLDRMVDKKVDEVIWCYAQENSVRSIQKSLKPELKIKYVKGVPDSFDNPYNKSILVVIDDLMNENYNKQICSLFVHGSHHLNLSIIYIVQNIFSASKHCRDISLNAKYMCIFKSPRDKNQFRYLANQICPEGATSLYNVYKDVTEKRPFSYIFIDMTQRINNLLRFRTNIFDKNHSIVFCDPSFDKTLLNEEIASQPAYAICFEECKPEIT